MYRIRYFLSGFFLLLMVCALIAGCTAPSGQANQTTLPAGTTTPAAATALYTAGDIVKNPKVSSDTAWLVIGYDPASDTYERALIYPNADGSWGYRSDAGTEKTSRPVMEKVYTEKLATVAPSSVPVVTPTQVATTETTGVSATKTVTTTTSATTTGTTVSSTTKPSIRKIIPDYGDAATTVAITDLSGNNFLAGANVTLSRSGSADIVATNVKVGMPTSLTCSITIPSDAPAGTWDVTVTNPGGLSATYTNLFSVHRPANLVTTTTVKGASGTIPITSIDPPSSFPGYQSYVIRGSKFQRNAIAYFKNSDFPSLQSSACEWHSETELLCFFNIPVGSHGIWDIVVTNPDATTGTLASGFTING
jgi:hypothetical protein